MLCAWSGAEATSYEYVSRYTITHMPPTIMVHGALDSVSPLANVYALQTLLQGLGVPSEVDIFPNAKHAFGPTDQQAGLALTLAFFQKYFGG